MCIRDRHGLYFKEYKFICHFRNRDTELLFDAFIERNPADAQLACIMPDVSCFADLLLQKLLESKCCAVVFCFARQEVMFGIGTVEFDQYKIQQGPYDVPAVRAECSDLTQKLARYTGQL